VIPKKGGNLTGGHSIIEQPKGPEELQIPKQDKLNMGGGKVGGKKK